MAVYAIVMTDAGIARCICASVQDIWYETCYQKVMSLFSLA